MTPMFRLFAVASRTARARDGATMWHHPARTGPHPADAPKDRMADRDRRTAERSGGLACEPPAAIASPERGGRRGTRAGNRAARTGTSRPRRPPAAALAMARQAAPAELLGRLVPALRGGNAA